MPAEEVAQARRPPRWRSFLLFLAVLGPGLITASVDNDAGGITTYSLAGSRYGYDLLWTLIPITVALIVVQEMSARMGVVTGKGLADLIRENFGVKVTFWISVALIVANLSNVVAEFAGVAASLQIFGVPVFLSVPFAAAAAYDFIGYFPNVSIESVYPAVAARVASTFVAPSPAMRGASPRSASTRSRANGTSTASRST